MVQRLVAAGIVLLALRAWGQPASVDAQRAMAAEWSDLTPYNEWDAQNQRESKTKQTPGAEHCLNALDLATKSSPGQDKVAALQELTSGTATPDAYQLPPELGAKIWDLLAAAVTGADKKKNVEKGKAMDAAQAAICKFYKNYRAKLLTVLSDIRKNNDLRAIYGLLDLAAGARQFDRDTLTRMEDFRLAYATDKKKLFGYVTASFQ